MSLHPLAGKPAPHELLANVPRLVSAYYIAEPDLSDPAQKVAFGTSGTEEIYKIYAESFRGQDHLRTILGEAQEIVAAAFAEAGL
ncbi:MAG: hypothetical protein JXA93_02795 [Anaerolineae bacterium]|nr:hypothetical protein [Anaerolineae bacterium]